MIFQFLGWVLLQSVVRGYQDNIPPNENWSCNGCSADYPASAVYGMIRQALLTEPRDAFLNFDNSWMDKLLAVKAHVSVSVLSRKKLSQAQLPELSDQHEKFQVVFVPPSERHNRKPLSPKEAEETDQFLAANPCWIPIQEPPVHLAIDDSSHLRNYSQHASTAALKSTYEYSAIYIQMASYWLYPTCKFFTYVTKHQFPATCPSAEGVLVNRLGNIGWANCLHPVIDHFIEALHHDRVYITPRAWDNGAAAPVSALVNGVMKPSSAPWQAWVDPRECDINVYAWNPWHCHFLSVSHCNNPELHDVEFIERRRPDPPTKSKYSLQLDEILKLRSDYGDGTHSHNWEHSRLMAFVQRPNAQNRYRLRRTLKTALISLRKGANYTTLYTGGGNSNRHNRGHGHGHGGGHGLLNQVNHHEPSLGIHIRHGDAMNDLRGESTLDRSLDAHVDCARDLAQAMGLRHIFLATDNVTLFSLAPTRFPEFTWSAQRRTLLVFNGMNFESAHNEKSSQQEIVNILADGIFMSRSSAFVGTYDSGFTLVMRQMWCTRNRWGHCPPNKDLWKCQPNARPARRLLG